MPPTMAPGKEPKPPRIAAAKPLRPRRTPTSYRRVVMGVIRTPARPPRAPARAKLSRPDPPDPETHHGRGGGVRCHGPHGQAGVGLPEEQHEEAHGQGGDHEDPDGLGHDGGPQES